VRLSDIEPRAASLRCVMGIDDDGAGHLAERDLAQPSISLISASTFNSLDHRSTGCVRQPEEAAVATGAAISGKWFLN
jgi:hypothetical protein